MNEPSPSTKPVIIQGSSLLEFFIKEVEEYFLNSRLVGKAKFLCGMGERLKLLVLTIKFRVNVSLDKKLAFICCNII